MKLWASFSSWINKNNQDNSKYIDLAPTNKADPSGIYSGALIDATKNPNVFNIAITGPYGSGKSSIIKTFLSRYRKYWFFKKPVLQISLASFLPEAEVPSEAVSKKDNVSKQEIERSILQQMLYGADANSLPLSRFKRIQSPKWWAGFTSLFIFLGLAACWYLLEQRPAILNGSFFKPLDFTNWLNFGCLILGFLFIWYLLHKIYIKSYGVSLKSISLKNIEITPEAAREESILNRHLDEIIYFFQSTKYDLIVIEDLDRFNNPDIFVTLREINSLINANAGVKRQIRFLYALRDNMFKSTERTKFFEFIIPVIPIINSSNSIDKILEQGERLSLDKRLDRQFLREVSRYLNDLRLINNIFNEYTVYVKSLEKDEDNVLNPNKLLAILIYKNMLPNDFEELHREKGNLAQILKQHETLISSAETRYKSQISELEQKISDAEKQVPSDLEELRRIYATALIDKLPRNYTDIEFNRQRYPIQSIWNIQDFEALLEAQQITCRTPQNHMTNVDVSGLQEEVNPSRTYQERKQEIENKSDEFKGNASKAIKRLRAKISSLRVTRFNEIMRTDTIGTEKLFQEFGENEELVKFLVLEGFLDDSYYQYTSLFHAGRLSPNDNKFLIQIRSFNNPEPNFQIDNPKEVIAAMRDDDFRQHFILNTILVDCLLSHPGEYTQQNAKLLEFLSSNFEECDAFVASFYERGKCVSSLMSKLLEKWPGFISEILRSSNRITHIAMLIAYLPEENLKSLQSNNDDMLDFISTNLSEVLAVGVDFDPKRLKLLSFETQELKSITPYPAVAKILTDEGLYQVSISNIEFIFRDVLGLPSADKLKTSHYTTVMDSGNETLINKVNGDFENYLNSVLLELESNSEESISTIIEVLNQDEIESECLESFLEKQSLRLPSLENIPLRFYAPIFRLQKIKASWANCLTFLTSESFNSEILTAFLAEEDIKNELSSTTISGDKTLFPLRQFLINNNDMEDDVYRTYIRKIPTKFKQFPESLDDEKLLILVEEEKILFSELAFTNLEDYRDYQVLFIAINIDDYFENKDQFVINDDFRDKLLISDITDAQKVEVIEDMDWNSISKTPSRASIIGHVIYRTEKDFSDLSADSIQAIITHSEPINVQISLFNKLGVFLSKDQIWETIHSLPEPFSEIKPGWRKPKIPDTIENHEFVSWLKNRSIISSWKTTTFNKIQIHPFRS
ncbi:hypothetical protein [Pseudoteredinibacter isoporae]|uniref:YobI family P-loop NTPase n=1 Tax=Pseudoteredinibacter isoporae TaxID=570281 RepID=UPI00310489C5